MDWGTWNHKDNSWRRKMKPEIIERKPLLLVGITNCGKDVTVVDIHRLWSIYEKSEAGIPNRIDGTWYELHVGNEPNATNDSLADTPATCASGQTMVS
jgi:hypothetical protein